jgi:tetratricopeptide (TPR) repeat protein
VKLHNKTRRLWIHPLVHEWLQQRLDWEERYKYDEAALQMIDIAVSEGTSGGSHLWMRIDNVLPDLDSWCGRIGDPTFEQFMQTSEATISAIKRMARMARKFAAAAGFLQSRAVLGDRNSTNYSAEVNVGDPQMPLTWYDESRADIGAGQYEQAESHLQLFLSLFCLCSIEGASQLRTDYTLLEERECPASLRVNNDSRFNLGELPHIGNICSIAIRDIVLLHQEPLDHESLVEIIRSPQIVLPSNIGIPLTPQLKKYRIRLEGIDAGSLVELMNPMDILAVLPPTELKELLAQDISHRVKATLGTQDPLTLRVLIRLAQVYHQRGKFGDAQKIYEHVLGIQESAIGLELPDVASTLRCLADLAKDQGRLEDAEELNKRIRHMQEDLGPYHADTIATDSRLANLYILSGRFERAGKDLQRVRNVRERSLGETHPLTLKTYGDLARLYRSEGSDVTAARDLSALLRHTSAPSRSIVLALFDLGLLFMECVEWEEAEKIWKVILGMTPPTGGEDLACRFLAITYTLGNKFREAHETLQHIRTAREKDMPNGDPMVQWTIPDIRMVVLSRRKTRGSTRPLRQSEGGHGGLPFR